MSCLWWETCFSLLVLLQEHFGGIWQHIHSHSSESPENASAKILAQTLNLLQLYIWYDHLCIASGCLHTFFFQLLHNINLAQYRLQFIKASWHAQPFSSCLYGSSLEMVGNLAVKSMRRWLRKRSFWQWENYRQMLLHTSSFQNVVLDVEALFLRTIFWAGQIKLREGTPCRSVSIP